MLTGGLWYWCSWWCLLLFICVSDTWLTCFFVVLVMGGVAFVVCVCAFVYVCCFCLFSFVLVLLGLHLVRFGHVWLLLRYL